MKLRNWFLIFLSALMLVLLVLFSSTLSYVKKQNRDSLADYHMKELERVFNYNKSSIIGNVMIGNDILLKEFLLRLQKQENVNISYFSGDETIQSSKRDGHVENIFDIVFSGKLFGKILIQKKLPDMNEYSFVQLVKIWTPAILLLMIITILFYYWFRKSVNYPLDFIIDSFNKESNTEFTKKKWIATDIKDLVDKSINTLVKYKKIKEDNDKKHYMNTIASQVAHDIRSPLTALDVAVKSLNEVDEKSRRIITSALNRIHDIANDLLSKNRKIEKVSGELSIEHVPTAIKLTMTEKRMQYRRFGNLVLEFPITADHYGKFIKVNSSDFKRVISNLINNAVEAVDKDNGKVDVLLTNDDSHLTITVKDNGHGISKEFMDKIKFEDFISTKKEGNAIGLKHTYEMVKKWGGSVNIGSVIGKGTDVSLVLPLAGIPKTFLIDISIRHGMTIAVVDDDESIHQVWRSRLYQYDVKLVHYYGKDDLEISLFSNKADLYLFDYEFIGQKENGLELIEKYDLADRSILVTSHFEENIIRERCNFLNVKLLEKSMAGLIPIKLLETPNEMINILLDDDSLTRSVWEMKAKASGVDLKTFERPEEVFNIAKSLSKDTHFYIDSNLGSGIKGEDIAQQIFDSGFKNIYLATGYEASNFKHLKFLKGILSKTPPWV